MNELNGGDITKLMSIYYEKETQVSQLLGLVWIHLCFLIFL